MTVTVRTSNNAGTVREKTDQKETPNCEIVCNSQNLIHDVTAIAELASK